MTLKGLELRAELTDKNLLIQAFASIRANLRVNLSANLVTNLSKFVFDEIR